ncbi:hypothetical protein A0J61_05044 [Choanephora cucurbitarum]|uniref:Uncharacterized protein n=1 Tax=Choanephora cucurbitarum TaxID=101091 RepID=A0A1C7NDQ8_9FUNG|nr:hypothetical protein A0J61_05044 [Choanephora cucurbitarum]
MNSWKLPGVRNKNKETTTTTTTERPSAVVKNEPQSGVLLIRICDARGITPPSDITLPADQQVAIQRQSNRDSLSRKQHWWLPYVVLEFDKNEVLIDSLGGTTQNPVYQYRAHFDVSRSSEVSISMYMRHPPPKQVR